MQFSDLLWFSQISEHPCHHNILTYCNPNYGIRPAHGSRLIFLNTPLVPAEADLCRKVVANLCQEKSFQIKQKLTKDFFEKLVFFIIQTVLSLGFFAVLSVLKVDALVALRKEWMLGIRDETLVVDVLSDLSLYFRFKLDSSNTSPRRRGKGRDELPESKPERKVSKPYSYVLSKKSQYEILGIFIIWICPGSFGFLPCGSCSTRGPHGPCSVATQLSYFNFATLLAVVVLTDCNHLFPNCRNAANKACMLFTVFRLFRVISTNFDRLYSMLMHVSVVFEKPYKKWETSMIFWHS